MGERIVEKLLEAAKSSSENDTSINLAKRYFTDESEARAFYEETRIRIFNIREWKQNSTVTNYDLFDDRGGEANSQPIQVGAFIRIALYGSGKYDWVKVANISDQPDEVVIKVKPSYDPTGEPVDRESISHFFVPEAENNFCLQRDGLKVAFYVIGLNEKQNTKFADGLIEAGRNAAVANIGYYSGLQKGVWKEFCLNTLGMKDEQAA